MKAEEPSNDPTRLEGSSAICSSREQKEEPEGRRKSSTRYSECEVVIQGTVSEVRDPPGPGILGVSSKGQFAVGGAGA